jgi:GGDEF domain-containing protein
VGGDEFVLVLPNTGAESAKLVIARIEDALGGRAPHCLGRTSAPEDGGTFDALYRVGDRDLYRRKSRRPPSSAHAVAERTIRPSAIHTNSAASRSG